jgi:hypothetical protein
MLLLIIWCVFGLAAFGIFISLYKFTEKKITIGLILKTFIILLPLGLFSFIYSIIATFLIQTAVAKQEHEKEEKK